MNGRVVLFFLLGAAAGYAYAKSNGAQIAAGAIGSNIFSAGWSSLTDF